MARLIARSGVEAIKASVYAGPPPVKTEAALRVCVPLLEAPVANRANWTIPRCGHRDEDPVLLLSFGCYLEGRAKVGLLQSRSSNQGSACKLLELRN